MESGPLIALSGLSKIYHPGSGMEVPALQSVDLEIERGSSIAIMGSSGSGKSTLMNIIGCLDRPTSGVYQLDGIDVGKLGKRRLSLLRNQQIGFVFQDFHLLPRTSALENVELPLLYHPQCPSFRELRARAAGALERVGLGNRLDHYPNQLSGGQQQRVAIARALINQPNLLLADEPTGNLDSTTTLEVMALFQELNAEGITVVLVTHEPEIRRYVRRVLVLKDGRIVEDVVNRSLTQASRELTILRDRTKREEPEA